MFGYVQTFFKPPRDSNFPYLGWYWYCFPFSKKSRIQNTCAGHQRTNVAFSHANIAIHHSPFHIPLCPNTQSFLHHGIPRPYLLVSPLRGHVSHDARHLAYTTILIRHPGRRYRYQNHLQRVPNWPYDLCRPTRRSQSLRYWLSSVSSGPHTSGLSHAPSEMLR